MKLAKTILIPVLCGVFFVTYGTEQNLKKAQPERQKNFDPERIAAAETAMWQAYYGKDSLKGKIKLAQLLIKLLQDQFGLKPEEAVGIAYQFTSSAILFKQGKYKASLPPLKEAYTSIKRYTDLKYDPEKVAKADLKWWMARRASSGKPAVIGPQIAHLYELLYGYNHNGFTDAGMLRAEAMHLRDIGRKKADWKKIEKLLLQSYQAMQRGLDARKLIKKK
jgi:hypothetical protein